MKAKRGIWIVMEPMKNGAGMKAKRGICIVMEPIKNSAFNVT